MTAQLIDGIKISAILRQEIKSKVDVRIASNKKPPGLAVILVGEDPASSIYVGKKVKACQEVGFQSQKIVLDININQEELLIKI